jgi:hypothetical protein
LTPAPVAMRVPLRAPSMKLVMSVRKERMGISTGSRHRLAAAGTAAIVFRRRTGDG